MIPALLRLPAVTLEPGALDELGAVIAAQSVGRLVVLGPQRTASGDVLDEFTLAAALVARDGRTRLGIATSVGAGRSPSVLAREATTAQLLGACEVLLLEGEPSLCDDAATIIGALFEPGTHTVTTPSASIVGAVNDPTPSVEGGPPVVWREAGTLCRLMDGTSVVVGDVLDVSLPCALPAPTPTSLVVAHHGAVPVDRLRAALVA